MPGTARQEFQTKVSDVEITDLFCMCSQWQIQAGLTGVKNPVRFSKAKFSTGDIELSIGNIEMYLTLLLSIVNISSNRHISNAQDKKLELFFKAASKRIMTCLHKSIVSQHGLCAFPCSAT